MFVRYKKRYFVLATAIAVAAIITIYQNSLLHSCKPIKSKYIILVLQMYSSINADLQYSGHGFPVILWWTSLGNDGKLRKCGNVHCYFTKDRNFQRHRDLRAILFYGSNFRINDLPNWKSERVHWGLMHEESPRNNPILVHSEALNIFNYSSTFSRFSDVPLTLLDLPGRTELFGHKYLISTREKNELIAKQNLAPLLYIQSDCDTASNRDSYVLELMRHIRVDSYGACLNNAQLDNRLRENYIERLDSEEFMSFVARYKFTLAFENAVCDDYITEKLWRPLIVGSVPVYYGSPTFKDWLPNIKSAISIRDFKNPETLAKFLSDLSDNDSKYEEYLSHKSPGAKLNARLIDTLIKDKRNKNNFGDYVEEFECFVCRNKINSGERKIVDTKQYDCPMPVDPVTNKIDKNNWWTKQWIFEKCSAILLARLLEKNVTIDPDTFEKDKMKSALCSKTLQSLK